MNIQNNRAAEVLYSTTYVEDYLDTVENLPDEIQRLVSRLIALDGDVQSFFQKVRDHFDQLVVLNRRNRRRASEDIVREIDRVHNLIVVTLMKSQELGDEKIQVAQQIQDFVDNRLRQLEIDRKTLDSVQKKVDAAQAASSALSVTSLDRDHRNSLDPSTSGTEKPVKRVRRVRLGPAIISGGPMSPVSKFTEQENTSTGEKQFYEREGVLSTLKTSSAVSSSHYASPVKAEKIKEKIKTSVNHSQGNATPTQTSAVAATSTGSMLKKTVNQADIHGSDVESFTLGKKAATLARSPKKKEKRLLSKMPEKRIPAPTTTKRVVSLKRKAHQTNSGVDSSTVKKVDTKIYCACGETTEEDMVGCDNPLCPIEWFHYSCVQINAAPKGKWFCLTCRDGKSNTMKTKEEFLKEFDGEPDYDRAKEIFYRELVKFKSEKQAK